MESFVVFADGAASGNPGPGGWGAVVYQTGGDVVIELGGGSPHTTNNIMEMTGAIEGLKKVWELTQGSPAKAVFCTDSKYVIDGISSWVHSWIRKGWRKADGEPVKNQGLWAELYKLNYSGAHLKVEWRHVRGHSGDILNERADEIARGFSKQIPPLLYRGALGDYPQREGFGAVSKEGGLGNSEAGSR